MTAAALHTRKILTGIQVHLPAWTISLAIAGSAGLIYLLTGPAKVHDAFTPLADAFLHGLLVVPDGSSMELVPRGDGWSYVPFPPVPALPLMATQALGIPLAKTGTLAALAGGAAVALVYPLMRALGTKEAPAVAATAALAGAILWMAATGGTWMYAQLLAAALLLAALNFAARDRWPVVAGLLLGLAAGSRLPVGLALPLLVYFYRSHWRRWAPLLVGVAMVALPIAAYNLARFGSPLEFGYGAIASWNGVATTAGEEWYADGIISPSYIPRSLGVMLFAGFGVVTEAPWLRPDWSGLSVALTAPAFLLAIGDWRSRLGVVALGTALLVMLPNWMHGNWGFYQYGYRFLLDAMPILLVALAIRYRDRVTPGLVAAIALSVAVNAFGLWADAAGWIGGPTF